MVSVWFKQSGYRPKSNNMQLFSSDKRPTLSDAYYKQILEFLFLRNLNCEPIGEDVSFWISRQRKNMVERTGNQLPRSAVWATGAQGAASAGVTDPNTSLASASA